MEFAITILLNHGPESNKSTKPSRNDNDVGFSKITQIMPMTPVVSDLCPALSNENLVANSSIFNRLVTELRKCFPNIPATNIIDFMAFWIHLFLFFGFNCYYWITYLDWLKSYVVDLVSYSDFTPILFTNEYL